MVDSLALSLVPAGVQHAALWHGWRQEAATQRFNPVDPVDVAEVARRLGAAGSDLHGEIRSEFRWMVARADGTLIGTVALVDVRWRMGYAEVAYGLGAAYHGQGYGTAAVRLLVDTAFAQTTLQRLWAAVAVGNVASRAILQRLGFVHEGTLRQHFVIGGVRTDEAIYGLLRDEWPTAKPP